MEQSTNELDLLDASLEKSADNLKKVNFHLETDGSVVNSSASESEDTTSTSSSDHSQVDESANASQEYSPPSLDEEELEVPVSIGGIHAKTLSDRESMQLSSSLRVRNSEFNRYLKEYYYAGVAPSKFNLARTNAGKYVTRFFRHHKWKTQRSKYLWQRIRINVLGDKAPEYDDDDEEEEDANYMTKMSQGFKLEISFKRPNEITAIVHNPKLPVHLLDGSLGYDFTEGDNISYQIANYDENEDEEDFFSETAVTKKNTSHTFIIIDSKKVLTIYDSQRNMPKETLKLEKDMTFLIFLPKYCLYAGLIEQRTIQFFTSKLDFTSSTKSPFPILILLYEHKSNELIGVGTNKIIIWSLESSYFKGAVCLTATIKMFLEPQSIGNQWISTCCLVTRMRQLWAVVDKNIYVYDLETGECVHYLKNVMARRITCITSHDSNSYMLVGSIDGTVKVLNIINATVHEFFAHSKPVVSVAVIPGSPMFVTVGLDNTLRLFNLKYFREICCIHLKERPVEMGMIDEANLFIRTRSYTEIWATNQFNVNFATMSSAITHLQYIQSEGSKFSKIFARTADTVARLLSPITGRTLTANLPPVENNEAVLDVAYYLQTERMYVLLETGDIWVFRTDQNPCTIVDLWNSQEARNEMCTKLLICHGEFDEVDAELCPPQLKNFGLLLAGTKKGHILLMGRGGFVMGRYQLHMGEITNMNYQEQGHMLITCGLDTRIRISVIKPFSTNLIQIQIDIITNYIPQAMSILGNTICVATDDASIQMFDINIKKQEWKILKGHLRGYDHTQRVIQITNCPETKVFLSIGLDNTLRIWSDSNKFLREIHFQEPLSGVCLANEKGDVLLGVGNRIDLVKSSIYLPSHYLKNKKIFKKPASEKPILFDDSLVPFTRAPKVSHRDREKILVDKTNPFEIFCETNLQWFERSSNIRRKPVYQMGADFEFGTTGADVDRFIQVIEEQMRQRRIIVQTQRRYQRRKSMGYDSSQEAEMLRRKTALLNMSGLEAVMGDQVQIPEEEEKIFVHDNEVNMTPAEKMDKKLELARMYFFPKDGVLPNSKGSALKKVSVGWRKIKNGVNLAAGLKNKLGKVSKGDNHNGDISKSKLHAKMKKMVEQEKLDEESLANVNSNSTSSVNGSENSTHKLRIGKGGNLGATDWEKTDAGKSINVTEITIPLSLERIMNYDWFPEDLLFHPVGYTDPTCSNVVILNSRGRQLDRIPKTVGNPDDLLPILVETFNNANSKTKVEIINYIKWVESESDSGFYEKQEDLAQFFCAKVSVDKVTDSEDVRNRIQMMEMTAEIPKAAKNLFETLLQQVKSPYNLIRYKALQIIRSMGLVCIEEPFIQKVLDTIPEMVEKAKLQFGVSYGDEEAEKRDISVAGMTKEFLQKALHRYLISSAQSIETSKILQTKNIFGYDDRARIEAQIARKAKDKKPKKQMPVVYNKQEEEVDIFERRLSIVDPNSFEENSKRIREQVALMRTRDLKSELNPKEYPKLTHVYAEPPTSEDRTPLKILQDPTLSDYIDALNFLYYEEQERTAELERKREAELLAQKRAHELLLAEQQRRADEMNAQQKLYQERIAAENARKERVRLLRLARKNGMDGIPAVLDPNPKEDEKKKLKFSEMQTLGIGKTHYSHCHTSRETIDVRYKAKPKLLDSSEGYINTSLAMHFKTVNRAMVMENVQLHNFAFEVETQDAVPMGHKHGQRPKTAGNPRNLAPSTTRPKTSHAASPSNDNNTNQDLQFIRGSLLEGGERSSTAGLAQRIPPIDSSASTPFLAYVQDRRQLTSREQADISKAIFQPGSKRFILPSQF